MNIQKIILIFVMLISVALVGCGGSSTSNPVATDNGMVTVRGSINTTEKATVSFCTPEAVFKRGISANTRNSMTNEGVYECEAINGRYSATIPSGDYYVIGVSGNMKSASELKSFRGAVTEAEDIVLKATCNLSGTVKYEDNSVAPCVVVFLENTPFSAITDSNGSFTFTGIPVIDSSYSLKGHVAQGEAMYSIEAEVTSEMQKSGSVGNLTLIKIEDEEPVTITGNLFASDGQTPISGTLIVAMNSFGDFFSSAITDNDGGFKVAMEPDFSECYLTSDWINFTKVLSNKTSDIVMVSSKVNKTSLLINDSNDDEAFTNSMVIQLALYKVDGSEGDCVFEQINVPWPLKNYVISDLTPGNYIYAVQSIGQSFGGSVIWSDEITVNGEYTEAGPATHKVSVQKPTFVFENGSLYIYNISNITFSDDEAKNKCKYSVVANNLETHIDTELNVSSTAESNKMLVELDNISEKGEYEISATVEVQFFDEYFCFDSDTFNYVKH